MKMHADRLGMLVCAGLLLFPATIWAAEIGFTEVRLFDGRVHKGILLEETKRELLIRTWVGDKRIAIHDIVDIRRNLSAVERAAILRSVDPGKDEEAWKERDQRFKQGISVDTPHVQTVACREAPRAEVTVCSAAPEYPLGGHAGRVSQGAWQQRMLMALDKRLSIQFENDPLEGALDLIRALTGLNIVVNPKVAEQRLSVSLHVRDMDAATVLKWLTKLTDTHIDVRDQALYITDKEPKEAGDQERMEALSLMIQTGVDPEGLMPPDGLPMTDDVRIRIATAIWDKTNPKPRDFPGPDISLGAGVEGQPMNPFVVPDK